MQQGSIYRQFWRYAIPTITAMLVTGLYQVIDGIFIGHYVGANGLAGIHVTWPVIGSIYGLGMLIGIGTGALSSIKQGELKLIAAKETLATGLLFMFLVAPFISVFLYFFAEHFLVWQGAQLKVLELGTQYLNILIFSSVFALGSIAIPFLLRNDGSPNFATLLMVAGALINIALDYLFIAQFGWELKGAALATSISQMLVTLFGIGYFFTSKAKMRLNFAVLRMRFRDVPQIVFIGASSFFMYAYGSVMVALHNSLFTQYANTLYIGAYAILGYIFVMYYLVIEGFANGMQPLVSYNHGAGNQENIKKLLRITMSCTVLGGIVFVALLNLFPLSFISIFNADNPTLMAYAKTGIHLHFFALFLDGFLVVAGAYYQSINRGGKAMFVTVGNMLVQVPFLFVMPKLIGVPGIWLAYPLSNIALSLVVVWMLYKDMQKKFALANYTM